MLSIRKSLRSCARFQSSFGITPFSTVTGVPSPEDGSKKETRIYELGQKFTIRTMCSISLVNFFVSVHQFIKLLNIVLLYNVVLE